MRLFLPLAAATALAMAPLALMAQTTTAPATTAPAAPAPAVATPPIAPVAPATPAAPAMGTPVPAPAASTPTHATKTKHGKRMTLAQRFDAANTTHDGHLTKEQAATAKWTYVNKHFDVMDADHKGYVTVDDIHGYAHTMHAARAVKHTTPAAPATTN